MLQEECKEKILSEEYRDFMMRDTGALGKNFPLENGCRIPLKYGFELFYIDQSEDRKKSLADYPYTMVATVYKGNIIKNLIMDCQSYTKYRPNETTGGIFVSWRRKEELPTGA